MDPCAIAERYAERVVSGKISSGWRMRAACERQIRDRQRWKDKKPGGDPYFWSPAAARHVIAFMSNCCRHVEGELAGQRIAWEPWQIFVLTTVYGWLRSEEGTPRRFRTVYEEVPRKNAKSTKLGGVGLYGLQGEGEAGAQVYSAATTFPQASIVWRIAKRMVERSKVLRSVIQPWARSLAKLDGSIFEPLHSKALSQEGKNPNLTLLDELHAHKTPEMWDVLLQSRGARKNPLQWAITTAGSDTSGICYEQRLYVEHILRREIEDDSYAGFIFAADEGDPWNAVATWRKANPNLGVSVAIDQLRDLARQAAASPRALATFKTKRLDEWVGAGTPFYDIIRWDALADPDLKPEDFKGERCWLTVDLAARYDVNALNLIFEKERHYYSFQKFFLPSRLLEPGAEEGESRLHVYSGQMRNWAKTGAIELTEGDVVDQDAIEVQIRAWADAFAPECVGFDPYQHAHLIVKLGEAGYPVLEVPPHVKYFSPAMKESQSLILDKRLHHTGNPAMRWMMTNVHAKEDVKGNIFPRKEKAGSPNKIDGPVAQIMGLNRAMVYEENIPGIW